MASFIHAERNSLFRVFLESVKQMLTVLRFHVCNEGSKGSIVQNVFTPMCTAASAFASDGGAGGALFFNCTTEPHYGPLRKSRRFQIYR